jgi:predicted nucleic acid-binding protein
MILVCNTGPLIALAKINRLSLLQHLGLERILIPPMVQKELWGKIGPESSAIESALNSFIQMAKLQGIDQRFEYATVDLDQREKEAVLLAASLHEPVILLIDDQAGRKVAREIGLQVLGTAGVLLLAKRRGVVENVIPLIDEIRRQGYWLSNALVAQVRRLAGEQEA